MPSKMKGKAQKKSLSFNPAFPKQKPFHSTVPYSKPFLKSFSLDKSFTRKTLSTSTKKCLKPLYDNANSKKYLSPHLGAKPKSGFLKCPTSVKQCNSPSFTSKSQTFTACTSPTTPTTKPL